MLHPHDEYPLHQAAVPMLQPVSGDPNVYDRYFFHGYEAERGMVFVVAMGLYPNRQIIDAAFCVAVDGHQRSVFASGRLSRDRTTEVGPIRVDVVEPMRTLRVTVDAPAQALGAEVEFRARSAAIQEPAQTMIDRTRTVMDTCRYTQFGRWTGRLRTGEQQVTVEPDAFAATRDRSWGVRPLAGAVPTAPATTMPGIFWLWSPVQLADACLHVALSEDAHGRRTLEAAVLADDLVDQPPWDADDTIEHGNAVAYDLEWEPGHRRARRAGFTVERPGDTDPLHVDLTPVGRVHMRGAGYTHLERGHGAWHGELDVTGEELVHADLDPADFTGLHVQQVVRVSGDLAGVGMLEQLHIGPHAPTGLTGFSDPPRRRG